MAGKDSTCVFPTEILQRNDEELRIVMVGKTGIGKSATGNTILGRQCFESKFSATSQTDECSKGNTKVDGQKVAVIDTPGLFDTRHDAKKTYRDITKCISYCAPGPHIFLVVIMLGRFTEEEKQTVQNIQEMFGEAADRYSMVLFTHGDLLKNTTIQKFISGSTDLQELVGRCNGQYHVFNNNEEEDRSQVTELLEKIRNIVQKNGGSHYTNEMFQEAERLIEEEKQRILKEKEKQIREEREELEKKLRAEYEEKLRDATEKLQADWQKERRDTEKKQLELNIKVDELTRRLEKGVMDRKEIEMKWERENKKREEEIKRDKEERQREWKEKEEEIKREKEERERVWRRREEELKREMDSRKREGEREREKEGRRREEQLKREKEEREREWRRREEEMKREKEEREREWRKKILVLREQWKENENKRKDREIINEKKRLEKEFESKLKRELKDLENKNQQEARKGAEEKNPGKCSLL